MMREALSSCLEDADAAPDWLSTNGTLAQIRGTCAATAQVGAW